MKNNPTYYLDLITRYFTGETEMNEIAVLIDWVQASPENKNTFEEYRKTWQNLERSKIESQVNIDNEWNELSTKIGLGENAKAKIIKMHDTEKEKIHFFKSFAGIAAVFVFLVASAYFLNFYFTKNKLQQIVAQTEILENKLPDGTLVTLNSGSSIEFPKKFKGNTREIKLKGEAYFDVSHDKTKAFIISANDIRIEVLGTSFYVNTKSGEDKMKVILNTGKVAVYYADNPDSRIIMLPDEKAEIAVANHKIIKSVNADENYMAWKTKEFIFRDHSLKEVVELLNKVYSSNIRLANENLENCRINTSFKGQSLESVLKVLEATLDLEIDYYETVIVISGEGCQVNK
ncbi:MAG: FecR domain-containing protein [Bacteroidales bacterium]|nr:FecR domain-containing protein [Bacteroidales bacterium]